MELTTTFTEEVKETSYRPMVHNYRYEPTHVINVPDRPSDEFSPGLAIGFILGSFVGILLFLLYINYLS